MQRSHKISDNDNVFKKKIKKENETRNKNLLCACRHSTNWGFPPWTQTDIKLHLKSLWAARRHVNGLINAEMCAHVRWIYLDCLAAFHTNDSPGNRRAARLSGKSSPPSCTLSWTTWCLDKQTGEYFPLQSSSSSLGRGVEDMACSHCGATR